MNRFGHTLILVIFLTITLFGQKKELTYYLPNISYNADIPTPEAFLSYQIGEWHISHDQQLMYMKALAAASPRVQLTEYGRSYENRPLVYLTITSEANQERIDEIQAQHQKLSDPGQSQNIDISNMPAVIYQGFSIHGNEPSGGNAAPLVAYYLAAGQGAEVEKLLNEVVILLDPCFNPDGFHRFSTWANMHKNKNLIGDPQDREYNEVWPRGRTNHYWFDLNRDWLPLQHPESRGRLHAFHEWKPNILTDHHEMGTNSTFFFMPGEPQRTNPITPPMNQELTGRIGDYHAAALDKIGSLYYSKEGYDDFYYGKGSTYPDANGCIGILFEQASSRGHLQESINGELSFPFTIRNQVTTALSTQAAAVGLREDLLSYQKKFYDEAVDLAKKDQRAAFVFGEPNDPGRLHQFLKILQQHQIELYQLKRPLHTGNHNFDPASSYVVPLEQSQYRIIRGIFDTMTSFQDSLFYDVSSWTLPLAFNIPYAELSKKDYARDMLGAKMDSGVQEKTAVKPAFSDYAYLLEWDNYYAPKAIYQVLNKELRAKVATGSFTLGNRTYPAGTIMIPAQNQSMDAQEIHQHLAAITESSGVIFGPVQTGLTPDGIDLGSNSFRPLKTPKVLLIGGNGVSSYEAGEVWHLLDQRYDIPITIADIDRFSRLDLSRYNTIVMVDGSYNEINASGLSKLKDWTNEGGTIIAYKRAVQWLSSKGLAGVEFKKQASKKEDKPPLRPYDKLSDDNGAKVIGGAIFEVKLDLSHPIAFGFRNDKLPVFRRGTLFFERSQNAYASPAVYTDKPLLSGYINASNLEQLSGSAAVVISGTGSGRVICLADNPNFRAFWYGTNKLFANALFFGNLISSGAVERPKPKPQ